MINGFVICFYIMLIKYVKYTAQKVQLFIETVKNSNNSKFLIK